MSVAGSVLGMRLDVCCVHGVQTSNGKEMGMSSRELRPTSHTPNTVPPAARMRKCLIG